MHIDLIEVVKIMQARTDHAKNMSGAHPQCKLAYMKAVSDMIDDLHGLIRKETEEDARRLQELRHLLGDDLKIDFDNLMP